MVVIGQEYAIRIRQRHPDKRTATWSHFLDKGDTEICDGNETHTSTEAQPDPNDPGTDPTQIPPRTERPIEGKEILHGDAACG